MTNALKPGEMQQIRRLSVRDFWKLRHETHALILGESLIYDGRFYGAEWVEKIIVYPWMECKKCGGYLRTEEQMKLHSEQNPGHDNFEDVKGGVMGMTYKPIFLGGYPSDSELNF